MESNTKYLALSGLFVALIIVGSFLQIPLPLVPFTLQVLFVNLAILMLGLKWGTISISTYTLMGLIGIPVFTSGGGLSSIVSPTFGFIIGFIVSGILAGLYLKKFGNTSIKSLTIATIITITVIYAFGVSYFYLISTLYLGIVTTFQTVFVNLFLLLLPGSIIQGIISVIIAKRLNKNI